MNNQGMTVDFIASWTMANEASREAEERVLASAVAVVANRPGAEKFSQALAELSAARKRESELHRGRAISIFDLFRTVLPRR